MWLHAPYLRDYLNVTNVVFSSAQVVVAPSALGAVVLLFAAGRGVIAVKAVALMVVVGAIGAVDTVNKLTETS